MVLLFLYIILFLVLLSVSSGNWLLGATANIHLFLNQNKVSTLHGLNNEKDYTNYLKFSDSASEDNSEKSYAPSGLKNLGNTCYMNSVLQSIYNIQQFREYLMNIEFKDSSVGQSLQHLFRELSESNHHVVTPISFCYSIGVNPRLQEDAQEFLLRLLNLLDDNVVKNGNDNHPSPANLPSHYFQGCLQQNIDCLHIPFTKSKDIPFYDISLDIQNNNNNSIETSLHSFFQSESLTKDCQYKTKEFGLQDAEKCITIKKLPKVLFLHLKRFSFDYTTEALKKISNKVTFPLKIDLRSFLTKNIPLSSSNNSENISNNNSNNNSSNNIVNELPCTEYLLRSIIIHQGNPNFGHYYCYTRPQPLHHPDKWFKINDDVITEVTFQDIMEVAYGYDLPPSDSSPGLEQPKQDQGKHKNGLFGFLRRSSQIEMSSNAYILQYSDNNTV